MAIGRHVHENNTEIHYVVEGRGVCTVQRRRIDYVPGTVAVTPRGEEHDVATAEGLRWRSPCMLRRHRQGLSPTISTTVLERESCRATSL
jgi:uncharacterized cupin superfamily protein